MNLNKFAQSELNRLRDKNDPDDEMQVKLNKCIMELISKYSSQRHSNMSAVYVLSAFKRLAMWKPLTPLTGEEDEWVDVSEIAGRPLWQNKRCISVYKDEDGIAWDNESVIFSEDNGKTWFRLGHANRHHMMAISFPYQVPIEPRRIILNNKEGDDDGEGVSEESGIGVGSSDGAAEEPGEESESIEGSDPDGN